MNSASQIGRQGEDLAIEYLRNNGFMICAQNWRSGRYEIDIVAQKLGTTHIVEVKTRRAGALITPEDAITPTKTDALHRAVRAYIAQNRVVGDIEIDLIAVDMFPTGEYDIRYITNIAEMCW